MGITALLVVVSVSAPVPQPKIRPAQQVTAGAYEMRWHSFHGGIVLTADGGYYGRFGDGDYHGTWAWCAETRVLTVTERRVGFEESVPYTARMQLDGGLNAPGGGIWLRRLPASGGR